MTQALKVVIPMLEIIEHDSDLSSVADRVIQEGERVRVPVGDQEVAVISLEDLEFLEGVENDLDLMDALRELREASKDKQLIPWEELLANLKRDRQSDNSHETD
jgi:hypothetical protein